MSDGVKSIDGIETAKPKQEPRYHTVRNCPVCGCLHLELKFFELQHPNADGSTHIARCPVKGDRILLVPPAPAQNKVRGPRRR